MTALCGGGTSAPKTGAAAVVDYASGTLAVLLSRLGTPWLIPVIPLAGLAPLVLSTFCATDPPAMPSFTSAEAIALQQLAFGSDFDSGLAKLKDLLLNAIWNDVCTCTSGAYAPAAAPSLPSGAATPISTPFTLGQQVICAVIGSSTQQAPTGTGANFGGFTMSTYPGLQFMRIHYKRVPIGVGPHNDSTLTVFWGTGSPVFNQTILTFPADGVDRTVDLPMLAGYTTVNQIGLNTSVNSLDSWDAWTELFCGPSGSQAVGCCPPDPLLEAMLRQTLDAVTLIQRQAVPFGYVAGTAHAGLSGAGSIAVSGLLGAKVDVTTLPSQYGTAGSAPEEIFDLGFISWGNPDGWPVSYRVDKDPTLTFPRVAALFTTLDYDLSPGVVVTITELLREA